MRRRRKNAGITPTLTVHNNNIIIITHWSMMRYRDRMYLCVRNTQIKNNRCTVGLFTPLMASQEHPLLPQISIFHICRDTVKPHLRKQKRRAALIADRCISGTNLTVWKHICKTRGVQPRFLRRFNEW